MLALLWSFHSIDHRTTETGRRPTWNGLRGDEHGEPGDDDEKSGRDVGLGPML